MTAPIACAISTRRDKKHKPLLDRIADQALDDLMDWIDAHLPYPAIIAGVILILIALKAIWRVNG
jgi:hypothetical protein